MLAANEVVAREIKNRLIPSIYRVHADPDPERLKEFRELALSYSLQAGDLTNRAEVQRLLAKIRGLPEEYALKLAFLKSLKRAAYETESKGHYGLAKTNYTHFTSPIRRYADLVVHRVLAQIASEQIPGGKVTRVRPATKELPAVAEHISATERVASDAEKESVKLKKLEYFQAQLRSRHPAAPRHSRPSSSISRASASSWSSPPSSSPASSMSHPSRTISISSTPPASASSDAANARPTASAAI